MHHEAFSCNALPYKAMQISEFTRWTECTMNVSLWVWNSETVYTRKFSHQTKHLLLRFSLPFTWQQRAGAPETANISSQDQSGIFWERNLLSGCVNWQAAKPVTVVATLMLMLAQISAFCSSHYQTLTKRSTVHQQQVEYDHSQLRWIWAFEE